MTPTLDLTAAKKRTSSAPGGNTIYPIPKPYYELHPETPSITIECPDTPSEPPTPAPQLDPSDYLLVPTKSFVKETTPEMGRKNLFTSISTSVKLKGKDIMKMMYSPHEESVDIQQDSQDSEEEKQDLVSSLDGSAKLWVGKDYVNFIVKDFNDLDAPFDDFIDRSTTPRMPWHDVGMCVQGECARDVARHFIHRWNAVKQEKMKVNASYNYLLPKSYRDCHNTPNRISVESHRVTCQVSY